MSHKKYRSPFIPPEGMTCEHGVMGKMCLITDAEVDHVTEEEYIARFGMHEWNKLNINQRTLRFKAEG